jgi:hypothetical protein
VKAGHAALLRVLQVRFEQHPRRHAGIAWAAAQARLAAHPAALDVVARMEQTGGEPDVIGIDARTGELTIFDCSAESPAGRRSICYDRAGLESRKEHRPENNAVDMAAEIGAELMDEAAYRALQGLGSFDEKTSSWVRTPPAIRRLGGALFCDRRYGQVFTYHNGAQSYYAARGFRCVLTV